MNGDAAPGRVFVVFVPRAAAERPHWWHGLLDRFRVHVVAVWQAGAPGGSVALSLNHRGRRLLVEPLGGMSAEDAARGLMWAWGAEALVVRAAAAPGAALRPPMTCVEAVKALLGIVDWRVWTPRQLRRALIRRGARALSPYPEGGA